MKEAVLVLSLSKQVLRLMLLNNDAQNITDRQDAEETVPFRDQERANAALIQQPGCF